MLFNIVRLKCKNKTVHQDEVVNWAYRDLKVTGQFRFGAHIDINDGRKYFLQSLMTLKDILHFSDICDIVTLPYVIKDVYPTLVCKLHKSLPDYAPLKL